MSKRINYPEYVEPSTSNGRQDGRAIFQAHDEIHRSGDVMGNGPPSEMHGVGCSNLSQRTNSYEATHTPEHVAQYMCERLGIEQHHSVLEPSAGSGGMVKVVAKYSSNITAVELNKRFYTILAKDHQNGVNCIPFDFLRLTPYSTGMQMFDRIIMCPPRNSDEHIDHAEKFLAPGGKLLALVQEQNINMIKYAFYNRSDTHFQLDGKTLQCGFVYLYN